MVQEMVEGKGGLGMVLQIQVVALGFSLFIRLAQCLPHCSNVWVNSRKVANRWSPRLESSGPELAGRDHEAFPTYRHRNQKGAGVHRTLTSN